MRGTMTSSFTMIARRSALLIRFSIAAMVNRALTPDFWSTNSLLRASNAICSMISRKNCGTRIVLPSRWMCASCSVILMASSMRPGIVRQDLGIDPVLQRRDDVAAVRVVFRIRREHQHDIQRDADVEPADLDVLLLQDIEEADLDAGLQVRELVDGKDAAVAPRDDAEVDRPFMGIVQALRRRLDRVDVADKVGDGHVGRRQLLAVSPAPVDPFDGCLVAAFADQVHGGFADRLIRVVVDLAPLDHRDIFIKQADQLPHDPGLRLSAQPEEDDVVLGQDSIDERRDDRLVVADNAGKKLFFIPDFADEIRAHFVLHAKDFIAALSKRSEGFRPIHGSLSWLDCVCLRLWVVARSLSRCIGFPLTLHKWDRFNTFPCKRWWNTLKRLCFAIAPENWYYTKADMLDSLNKTLIIRFSSVGDIVLSSLLVRTLRHRFPQIHIDFLLKSEYADLVRYNPHVNRVIEFPSGGSIGDLIRLRRAIRSERYDLVVDIHDSIRSRLLSLGARKVVRVDKRKLARWLLVNFKRDVYSSFGGAPGVAERYLETVQPYGVQDDGGGLELHVPPEIRGAGRSTCCEDRGILPGGPGDRDLPFRKARQQNVAEGALCRDGGRPGPAVRSARDPVRLRRGNRTVRRDRGDGGGGLPCHPRRQSGRIAFPPGNGRSHGPLQPRVSPTIPG